MLQQESDSLFIHQATLHSVSNENSLKINEIIGNELLQSDSL